MPGFEGVADAGFVGFSGVVRDGPCAAMHEQRGVVSGWGCHWIMVQEHSSSKVSGQLELVVKRL